MIPLMKLHLASLEMVIDVNKLDNKLRYIRDDGGTLRGRNARL